MKSFEAQTLETLVDAYMAKNSSVSRRGSRAVVSSGQELDSQDKQHIAGIVTKLGGSQDAVQWRVERDLLGGIKIQVGEWFIDTTLRGKLAKLVTQLKENQKT